MSNKVKREAKSNSEVKNKVKSKFPKLTFPKKIKHFNSGKELYDFLEKKIKLLNN